MHSQGIFENFRLTFNIFIGEYSFPRVLKGHKRQEHAVVKSLKQRDSQFNVGLFKFHARLPEPVTDIPWFAQDYWSLCTLTRFDLYVVNAESLILSLIIHNTKQIRSSLLDQGCL